MAAYSAHHKAVAAGDGGVHGCHVCGVLVCRQVCDAGEPLSNTEPSMAACLAAPQASYTSEQAMR